MNVIKKMYLFEYGDGICVDQIGIRDMLLKEKDVIINSQATMIKDLDSQLTQANRRLSMYKNQKEALHKKNEDLTRILTIVTILGLIYILYSILK